MNIKNRLKKLEVGANVGSEFCECFPKYTEIWQQTINEDSTDYTEPVLMGEAQPDFCEKCGKPVNKQQIIVCFGDLDNPLPEMPFAN